MKTTRPTKSRGKVSQDSRPTGAARPPQSEVTLIPTPIADDKRVDRLFVWISKTEAGGEGIIAAKLPRVGWVYLMASRKDRAFNLRSRAEEAMILSHTTPGATPIMSVDMIEFVRVSQPE